MGVRIKGQSFVGFLGALRKLEGEQSYRACLAQMPSELAQAIQNGEVLSMGWYSLEWYREMHLACVEVCGVFVTRRCAREATRNDVNNIYRFILKFFSPETLMKQADKVFSLFCDGGKCRVEASTRNSVRIRYLDCPGAPRAMWESILASTETLVELCGGKEVQGRAVEGGGEGDPSMLALVTWQ